MDEDFYYPISQMREMLTEYDALSEKLKAAPNTYEGYWRDVEQRDAIISMLEMQALEMARYIVRAAESEG